MIALLSRRSTEPALLPGQGRPGIAMWLIAIMVFLATLGLAAYLAIAGIGKGLESDLSRRVTVQLAIPNPDQRAVQAARIVAAMKAHPDVAEVEQLGRDAIVALIEPWFGKGNVTDDLPLPELVDVTLIDGDPVRITAIVARIKSISPTARVDSQAAWLGPLSELFAMLQWLLLVVVALMMASMIAVVALATRAQLNTHRETMEVIHLIGAHDRQLCALFERRAFAEGLMGGVIGMVIALTLLGLIRGLSAAVGTKMFVLGTAGADGLWLLFLLPVAAALLARFSARRTVLSALRATL